MARQGLLRAIALRLRSNDASANYIEMKPPSGQATNVSYTLLGTLPGSTSAITIDSAGVWGTSALSGGGTVSSFSATAPSDLLGVSVATNTTTPALTLSKVSTAINLVYASPTGAAGNPTFRSLAYSDITGLVGTATNTIAAGNDSRFHTANTDTGTTQTSFQINSGATGARLKADSTSLSIRNAGDTANVDLVANNLTLSGNLTVSGTTTVINSETVTVDDNIIVLNNNVSTGTPTEDGGIQIRRGASTSASMNWDETGDFWEAGLVGSELRVARYTSFPFTSATLTANQYAWNHGLGNQYPDLFLVDNNNKRVDAPDDVTYTDVNNLTIDLTTLNATPITGTWRVVAVG